jgi:MFS family permease
VLSSRRAAVRRPTNAVFGRLSPQPRAPFAGAPQVRRFGHESRQRRHEPSGLPVRHTCDTQEEITMSSAAAQAAAPSGAPVAHVPAKWLPVRRQEHAPLKVTAPSSGGTGVSRTFHDWQKWIVVAAATFGLAAGFGIATSVAVFLKPFESEFGWLRADISFAYALLTAGAALGGLVSGRTIDLIDTRPVVVFGALVIAAGLIALSRQNDLATIQYIYLAIGVFGFACLYTPLIATVGLWFDRGRGLAMGIVTAGGTLGQAMVPLILQPLIDSFGWRDAYLYFGLGYLVLLVPAMLLVTKPPAAAGQASGGAPGKAAWSLPPLVSIAWLGIASIFCCVAMAVPLVHLIALFIDRGLSPAVAGSLLTTVMLAGTVGRIVQGMIADRLGGLPSCMLASIAQTATVYWFVELQSLPSLYLLAAVFGFGYSGVMTGLLLSVREAVPARATGISIATVTLLAWAGMGVGGYQGGYCFDLTGSYSASFANAAYAGLANFVILCGLALHLRLHGRPRPSLAAARPLS